MKPLDTAFRHALSYLDQLDDARVGATATLDELRQRFDVPLTAYGVDGDRVIDDLVAATRGGLHASTADASSPWRRRCWPRRYRAHLTWSEAKHDAVAAAVDARQAAVIALPHGRRHVQHPLGESTA